MMAKEQFELRYGEGIEIYEDARVGAMNSIVDMGFRPMERPINEDGELEDSPSIPSSLSDLSPSELGDLLAKFTQWFQYATERLQHAKIDRNARFKQKDFAWSAIRRKKAGTVADKDNNTKTDGRYVEVDADFEEADAVLLLLEGIVRGMDRGIDTISRSVTVMDQRLDVEGASAAISRKRYPSSAKKMIRGKRNRR
jgi:hypothetical protein